VSVMFIVVFGQSLEKVACEQSNAVCCFDRVASVCLFFFWVYSPEKLVLS
jgi:hypothetical protein